MFENNEKRAPRLDLIALPPLRMALVHAKDEHVSKAALAAAIRKIAFQPVTMKEHVEPQVIRKIIRYLEQKS